MKEASKDKVKSKEISKENRIKTELERISIFYEEIAENQRAIVAPLLQNAAFMKVTLEDIQDAINESGPTDEYQNGANQHGIKQSAMLQSYNALIKNYASVIKTLSSLLPYTVKNNLLSVPSWSAPEKTDEELETEMRLEEARRRRINKEIAEAAERLRRQREEKK